MVPKTNENGHLILPTQIFNILAFYIHWTDWLIKSYEHCAVNDYMKIGQ